ncbi:SusE domain-containing protein [Winogradskyella psychrotolerans]|uniref:SusE domain-containing protein n=1 Tax=Winogradskyella psychrotolerans TaxID=1344585 RepID=UPI001C07344A|nr:SusF/SusE family outer membrane protein [Winogradskyella psychrotolerans]MBU2927772.1 SusE domain-containing protein [Winogradskyella psychrotolerans]
MKNKIKTLAIFFTLLLSFSSCETDDDLTFVAAPQGDFEFNNTFLSDYVLPAESTTNSNIGAIFSFNEADFDVQTNVSYELQSSILGDFTDATMVSALSNANNQIEVSIGTLKTLAEEYGIVAPNSGVLNFRVRAYPGDTSSTTEMFTSVQQLNVTLLEETTGGGSDIEPATWGVVGSGYNDWGSAGSDGQFYTTTEADVYVAYVTLIDGEIKFRENNDWASDLGDNDADGTVEAGGANITVTAGTYKITLNTAAATYTMEEFSWGVVGDAYNDWGATPDAKFYYDYTTDMFKVDVKLLDGEMKFRLNNAWDTSFPNDNITVAAGHYSISINLTDNTYTMEESDVWGIVGSGYNDWGATPDFALTQIQPDLYVGEIATLLDGEIKFRLNNDWASDFGDTGADGTLDAGGDNIVVTAGLYRVQMDTANGTYMLNKIQ